MRSETERAWIRDVPTAWISGVSGALARATGLPVAAARALLALAVVGGGVLAVALAIYDRVLLGAPLEAGIRLPLIGLGLLLALSYPLLALLLPEGRTPRRWDFGSAVGAVVVLVLIGQALGFLLEPYWRVAENAWRLRGHSAWLSWPVDYARDHGVGPKDGVLVLFFLSAGSFLWLQRSAVRRFFRSMHTGVSLVSLTLVAVSGGVLVPQIDGFEDTERRVNWAAEREDYSHFKEHGYQKLPASLQDGEEQYQAFRWAEGYFLYHLLHPYGIGMPEVDLTPRMEEGLERFGMRYGVEERDNRRKQMIAALTGREKIGEIGDFIHRNEDEMWRGFQAATLLQLNRTYKSHWFATLLGLLGGAIVFNTLKGSWRSWFTVQKFGFFLVHTGMIVLLLGGWVSKLFTDRGILHLDLREGPRDVYHRNFDPDQPTRMPFAVGLDHFARSDWKALEVHFLDEEFSSRPPRHTLWEGRTIDLDHVEGEDGETRPGLRLVVRELHDRVEVGLPHVREAEGPGEGQVPLAEVVVEESRPDDDPQGGGLRRLYLLPILPSRWGYRDPAGAFRVAAAYGDDPRSVFPEEEGVLGAIEVRVPGQGDGTPLVVPIRVGDEFPIGGGYEIRVVDAAADFGPGRGDREGSQHPLPLEAQPHRFAAIWIDVVPPDDGPVERRLVLEAIDAVEHGQQDTFFHAQIETRLSWDPWTSPGPPRYVLHWGPDREPRLLPEEAEVARPVVVGQALPLPGETKVELRQLLHSAVFDRNIEFLVPEPRADGWDADFYARTPRGLVLDVIRDPGTPDERRDTVELATTEEAGCNFWLADDERFYLHFLENTEMLPFEWRSVLSIYEKGPDGRRQEVALGSERRREIRVNDYFQYGGYRLFQTNAITELPDYSGIGVVYDPGIPMVLTGMYIIIAGTAFAFLVRPIVRARRKPRTAA